MGKNFYITNEWPQQPEIIYLAMPTRGNGINWKTNENKIMKTLSLPENPSVDWDYY